MRQGVNPSLLKAHPRRAEIHPQGWGIPFALSEVEGSQERNGVVSPPPKSDTNPLTKAKHMYYIHPQARHLTSALIRKRTKGVP